MGEVLAFGRPARVTTRLVPGELLDDQEGERELIRLIEQDLAPRLDPTSQFSDEVEALARHLKRRLMARPAERSR